MISHIRIYQGMDNWTVEWNQDGVFQTSTLDTFEDVSRLVEGELLA